MLKSFGFALALTLVAPVAMAKSPIVDFENTCAYFENRAFGIKGTERMTWLSLLSDSCAEALEAVDQTPPFAAQAHVDYLTRLSELRTTIIEMNVSRFRERRARQARGIMRTVTPSGEYLIAKQIGVMTAYQTWVTSQGTDTAALP